jgi:hypothetical protein
MLMLIFQMLEESIRVLKTERDSYEHVNAELKATLSADQIELKRLKTLLETEISKVKK